MGIQNYPIPHFSLSYIYLHIDGRALSKDAELRCSTIRMNEILQIGRHHILDKKFNTVLADQAWSPRITYNENSH